MKVLNQAGFGLGSLGWQLPLVAAVVILLVGNAVAAAAFGFEMSPRYAPLLEVAGKSFGVQHGFAAAAVAMVLLKIAAALGAAELFRLGQHIKGLVTMVVAAILGLWSANATASTLGKFLGPDLVTGPDLAVAATIGMAIEAGGLLGLLVLSGARQPVVRNPPGPAVTVHAVPISSGRARLTANAGPGIGPVPVAATAEASELIARWSANCICAARDARIGASEAYEAFLGWCARSGHRVAVSQRRFASGFVAHLGLERERTGPGGQVVYRGATLASSPMSATS